MLRPQPLPPLPDETARIARAAFPKGHPYLALADTLGELFADEQFAALFPQRGQPALAPWRLALATILQFAEGLSDIQASNAVRGRIDWKYVLRLELTDAGFDASVLCEFRARLAVGGAEDLLLDALLTWCRDRGLLKTRGKQRTDSTHVLAKPRHDPTSVTPACTPDSRKSVRSGARISHAHAIACLPSVLGCCQADCTPASHIMRRGVLCRVCLVHTSSAPGVHILLVPVAGLLSSDAANFVAVTHQ